MLQIVASSGWGGLELAVLEISEELSATCDVEVMLPSDAVFRGRFSPDVRVHSLPPGGRRNPFMARRLGEAVRELGPDIVHTHAARATEMVWWAARAGAGGLGAAVHVATKHNTRVRRIFDRVGTVTAVSAAVGDTIRNPRGVAVVANGVRVRHVAPQPESELFTLVAVGRLDRYKGFDLLVDAVADLTVPFRLKIVGEGGERSALETRIRELGLGDRVELLGHRDDVPELIAGAHAQIVCSRSEGFGLVVVEGLHYARLLAATPVGIAPDVLPPELLLDPADLGGELQRIHRDYASLRACFVDRAAPERERFTWRAAADGYRAVYERALAARGR